MAIAACLAAAFVAGDILLATSPSQAWRYVFFGMYRLDLVRACMVLVALLAYGRLGRWDRYALGLRFSPRRGWVYWIKVTALLGGVVLAIVVAVSAIAYACGVDPERHHLFRSPADFWPWIRHACLVAPVLEEGIYRFILCVPLVVLAGPRVTILVSGCLFAGLHFAYGNPSPDNFVAGFILSWAFLKSGSVLVPVGLHSLGNLCAGLIHLLDCYV